MAWKSLAITGPPYRNTDETELDAIQAVVQDAIVDELNYTVKRPGLTSFIDLGTSAPIDGLYWWNDASVAVAVSAGRIWAITDLAGTKVELTSGSALLNSGTRVTFSPNYAGTTLVMANGTKMVKATTAAGSAAYEADANAPTTVSHVAFLDGYVLANKTGADTFWWPAVNTFTWNASNFASANGNPDFLTALHVGWREVLLVGPNSVEVWFNDGVTPFSRLQGGYVQRGCAAPYTVQQVGSNWMWLDENRHFVMLDNRTPTVKSTPFDKLIQGFSDVSDAVSDMIEIEGYCLYIVNFAQARKTLVYNYPKDSWQEWGYWNTVTGSYERWRGNGHCYARPWNLHLVGDLSNGKIYKMSRSYFDDNGNPMRSFRRTGWITHGTQAYKRSVGLRIRCKRALGNATVADPTMVVRWRDDDGAWGNDHNVSLGQVGEHFMTARLFRLGRYRMRQYEFIHSDASDWILVDAEEDVEGLDIET